MDTAAKKLLSFIERGVKPACYLYRHYHPNGDLLYVGISRDALGRQYQHNRSAPWRAEVYKIVVEPFETREAALEAERIAIKTEAPKYNTMSNPRAYRGWLLPWLPMIIEMNQQGRTLPEIVEELIKQPGVTQHCSRLQMPAAYEVRQPLRVLLSRLA